MDDIILCPSCKGKGHVFDAITLFIPIYGLILSLIERNNPSGFTREKCRQCRGAGFIKPKTEE